ncbi:MAG: hypothetical protein K9G49_07490 [Taibaiella sp.]|nr:hypothetical protein [Taibaiella sp.]
MTATPLIKILKKLLLHTGGRARVRIALLALCTGTTLFLLSVLTWWNFGMLLNGDAQESKTSTTYILIAKQITEQNMSAGAANSFTEQETESIKTAPQVTDVGEIIPARFPVYAMIGGRFAMSTDLPLECVPDRFIDNLPDDWAWQPGNSNLPVILSSQFLDIYNYVFAPGQGLPQLSRSSVKSIALKLQVGGTSGQSYSAHVSGFSDYVGSVLVPESFITFGNMKYAAGAAISRPSQLILKVKDPSDNRFTDYLQQHGYTTNPQNLRWSKMRSVVAAVTGTTGILALLLMGISALVFVLFIELTITRAQSALGLLQQLGYSPQYLSRFLSKHFLPAVSGAMFCSMIMCVVVQAVISYLAKGAGLVLPIVPGLAIWMAFGLATASLCVIVLRSISKSVKA